MNAKKRRKAGAARRTTPGGRTGPGPSVADRWLMTATLCATLVKVVAQWPFWWRAGQ